MPTKYTANAVQEIGMVAAGTGITPMYQMIRTILSDPLEKTKIKLFYLNKTPQDILLRQELDVLQRNNPERLNVVYSVDQYKGWDWTGKRGLRMKDLKDCLPDYKLDDQIGVLVCGPDGFVEAVAGKKVHYLET